MKDHIAIIGESNGAIAFEQMVREKHPDVLILRSLSVSEQPRANVSKYYVLNDDDTKNIKACLDIRRHTQAQIYSKFRNKKFGENAQTYISNLSFITPSNLAADAFIQSLSGAERTHIQHQRHAFTFKKINPLIERSILTIFYIILFSVLYFRHVLGQTYYESLYLTIKTMVTGDTVEIMSSNLSKGFYMLLMSCSLTCIAIIFALVGESITSQKKELTLGSRKYRGKNHIIIVGGGSVGYNVIKKLIEMGETPVLIDNTLDGQYLSKILDLGVPFIIGDARDESLLVRAGLYRCKAVMSLTQNDLTNMEVGLDVKTMDPNLRVVLRIFDQNIADNLKENGIIKYTHSMSNITASHLIKTLII